MKIAASRLSVYLDEDIEVRVCHQDGSLWRTMLGPAVQILADKIMITGIGSRSRLKCVVLNVPSIEAEDEIERTERANSVRGRLAQSQASRTLIAQRWSNHIGAVTVYRHLPNAHTTQGAFSPQSRLQIT